MTFLKSIAAGLVTGVAACVVWVIGAVAFAVIRVALVASSGSGGLGAVSVGSEPLLYIAPIGFALGFIWRFRQRPVRQAG